LVTNGAFLSIKTTPILLFLLREVPDLSKHKHQAAGGVQGLPEEAPAKRKD